MKNLLVLDAIDFKGGSKISTANMLSNIGAGYSIDILTLDPNSWKPYHVNIVDFSLPDMLSKYISGLGYYFKTLYIVIKLLRLLLRKNYSCLIGSSSPGVDFSLHIVSLITRIPVVQIIHGPIANSKVIRISLKLSYRVFYLDSLKSNVSQIYNQDDGEMMLPNHFHSFVNGIPIQDIEISKHSPPIVFWAASLLKWKGLSFFIESLSLLSDSDRPTVKICYIKPKSTNLEIDRPVNLKNVHFFCDPDNLSDIRLSASIFVSTSKNEPFGLSILEALAAGMLVIIPRDGSYWDKKLIEGIHCIKYEPNNPYSLIDAIKKSTQSLNHFYQIRQRGKNISSEYDFQTTYSQFNLEIRKILSGYVVI